MGPARLRRLTAAQYRASIKDLLAIDVDTSTFIADAPTGPFATNTLVPPQEAEIARYEETADVVATRAIADPKRLLECDPATMGEQTCVERFLGRFLPRLYRRPAAAVSMGWRMTASGRAVPLVNTCARRVK